MNDPSADRVELAATRLNLKMVRERIIIVSLFIFCIYSGQKIYAQQPFKSAQQIPANFRITDEEMKLYRMINEYRRRYDLPAIPLSVSLCYVASSHVRDLVVYHPDQAPCNSHSWSDKGPWKPFCYPKDENKKNSVWDKPREFTPYKGKGFEIVYSENNQVIIDSVMAFWKSEGSVSSLLINTGKWQGQKWEAMGVGIFENYACAWFGEIPDPSGSPLIAGKNPVPASNDSMRMSSSVPKETLPGIKYYIIVRTNVTVKDSEKVVRYYKEKGYPDAKFLSNEGKGRISVFETADRNEAMAKLREIKTFVSDAWMLKIQ